jgi:hypothetical protein
MVYVQICELDARSAVLFSSGLGVFAFNKISRNQPRQMNK